jgi:hypothetical protein
MAFDKTDLGLESAALNSTLPRTWLYTTADAKATVDSAGYFNKAAAELKVGDLIRAKCSTGGTTSYDTFFVSANDGTTVDVNDSVIYNTTTDTD